MQASVEIDALGGAAAGAVSELVELDRTSERSDVAKAAIEVLGKIHRAKATLAATRQEILDGFVVCLDEAKEHAAVIHAGLRGDRRAGRRRRRSRERHRQRGRASRRRALEAHAGQADDAPWLWRRRTFRGASLQFHTAIGTWVRTPA